VKAVVTGAAGFIGSHLTESLLADGIEVTGLDCFADDYPRPLSVYGDGKQTRDFTFVSDIVGATRAAAVSGRPGSVYNVGGGERVELNQVLRLIEEISARPLQIRREEVQKGDMRDTFADTTAAARSLGFHSAVGLAEGLAREWEWLRGHA